VSIEKIIRTIVTASFVLTLQNCRSLPGNSDLTSTALSKADDSAQCADERKHPLISFGLWKDTQIKGHTCRANLANFLSKVNDIYSPRAISFPDFDLYYPVRRTQASNGLLRFLEQVMYEAVHSEPNCPMILFNISCFDADTAFKAGCGLNFPISREDCVTAFEADRILSDPLLFNSTIWYEERGSQFYKLTTGELKAKFGAYFPQRFK